MAYVTGATSTPSTLLDSLAIALSAANWNIHRNGTDTGFNGTTDTSTARFKVTADRMLAVTSPNGNHFILLAVNGTNGRIGVASHTGSYNGAFNRDSQVGITPSYSYQSTNGLTGPFTGYHFFIGDSYCHIVIERTTNNFSHIHFGCLEKAGNYTGGEYTSGTYWTYGQTAYQNNPDIYYNICPFDSYVDYNSGINYSYVRYDSVWYPIGYPSNLNTSYAVGFMKQNSVISRLFNKQPNTLNGLTVFMPSLIYGPTSAGGSQIYGTVKDLRPINMQNLVPKEVITIGTDEWIVFPLLKKGTGTISEAVSGNYGYALKKVL